MSTPQALLRFQQTVAEGMLARLAHVREQLDALPANADPALRDRIARNAGAIVLCAPTGSGKTLLAAEILSRLPNDPPTLWFWFAPFAGLIEQARGVLRTQAPALRLFDLDTDRNFDAVAGGGVFVTTWQSVAAANRNARRARTRDDAGLALDDLLTLVRDQGIRIGCVVDEAHHGFHKAKEAREFFTDVLRPDYALMMTATPRDSDVAQFERDTGYRVGDADEWMTVSRRDGVEAGLLKRGVKVVRFVAPDNDTAALVDFERTALAQCAEMHRHIAGALKAHRIALTPLMLVQVPNGDKDMREARRVLIEELGFADSAVRIHTAKEPDADIIALAWDPTVEVLIFKMAVALGFDAPRAFTLAALRGARDKDFGIQVIGRLMRVHPLLRRRPELPAELSYGFVFLANSEEQEGLLSAGQEIEKLSTNAPALGTQTVVTVLGNTHTVQILRSGETGSLLIGADGTTREVGSDEPPSEAMTTLAGQLSAISPSLPLFPSAEQVDEGDAQTTAARIVGVLTADAGHTLNYPLRDDVPKRLTSEYLPPIDGALEERIADHVDFSSAVLGSMHQTLARLLRVERDVFSPVKEDRETYILAQLGAAQIAHRLERQIGLFDVDAHALLRALTDRFVAKLPESGFQVPKEEEAIDEALDIVLVRHPELLANAYRMTRMAQVSEREIDLPASLVSVEKLEPSRRNIYRVYPPGFDSQDERDFAALLDRSDDILWWHRNPARRPESLVLYRWNDGAAFHPDFVVAYRGRETEQHIALVEIKGARGWGDLTDIRKASGPAHPTYGRCFFIGREKKDTRFKLLKPQDNRLEPFADFEVQQLRWVER
ncbi:MAG TPA: DEAD/DEAH box helicase family protein [Rhodanobacteraceae bacterium]|nr:DEAD/DEAH box helicase family protein [Rhodanobacteraceae bacterium]